MERTLFLRQITNRPESAGSGLSWPRQDVAGYPQPKWVELLPHRMLLLEWVSDAEISTSLDLVNVKTVGQVNSAPGQESSASSNLD